MTYVEKINAVSVPKSTCSYKVLDLFAGCGGLSLGFEAAGFETVGYEMDVKAAESYNKNLLGTCFAQKLDLDTEYGDGFDVVPYRNRRSALPAIQCGWKPERDRG